MKKKKDVKKGREHLQVIEGQGRRFSFSRLKQAFAYYLVLLLALVVIVQLGYHWLSDQYLAWRLQIVAVEQGINEQKEQVSGLVTRHEEVVRAPGDGIILKMAEPGSRVSVGEELVEIRVRLSDTVPDHFDPTYREEQEETEQIPQPGINENGEEEESPTEEEPVQNGPLPDERIEDERIDEERIEDERIEDERIEDERIDEERAEAENNIALGPGGYDRVVTITGERAGLLSYYIDGLERHSGAFYLPREAIARNLEEASLLEENAGVASGQPILKIVDNWRWYYNIVLPLHSGRRLADHGHILINFDFAPQETVEATLYRSHLDEETNRMHLSYLIEKELPGFDQVRWSEASLLYDRQRGIIVPAEAVFKKNGKQGVFLNRGGRVVFVELGVIDLRDNRAVVEGIDAGSLVITRHELVEEGQRLN